MENNVKKTNELQGILDYMNDNLKNEFPTDVFTPEYLIAAILSIKRCHANIILDNCLMTNNIEELKEIYFSYLQNNINPSVNLLKNVSVKFDDELQDIFDKAIVEKDDLKSDILGSEHVLLSILNPNNTNKIQDVFKAVGLDYSFIKNKCFEESQSKNKKDKDVIKKKSNALITPPSKNEINNAVQTPNTQFIDLYTTNLNKLAKNGKIDELIGRDKEIEQIIKVLARRKKNNVVIVGKGGTGKTSIVNNLARLIQNGDVPDLLKDKEIVMLNVISLVSGTHFRGMFEERVKGLFDELKNTKNYILFIDDIHTVLKGSGKDKDTDISSMIGEILTEGDIRVIGTTNFKEYRNCIESNTSISRKLQKIVIEPSSVEDSIEILMANKKYYEDYHNVTYSYDTIKKCVELSDRYITDRCLPDSAFDVIDLSGAYTCFINREPQDITDSKKRLFELEKLKEKSLNQGDFESVERITDEENAIKLTLSNFKREYEKNKKDYCIEITVNDISNSVSEMTGIPVNKLSLDEKKKIAHINDILKESIVGQDEAINEVCRIIKRNRVGLGSKNKCMGVSLLAGKSGTGKSFLAKQLAKEIFGDENAMVRIDMSEYSEKSSVSKLIGASAGYIGYENGGQLTEAIKHKQHCVLLLDEIEKADQEVYNIFLQLFDEGRLTDNSGQVVNFKNVIVLMTSNVGARKAAEMGNGVGFVNNETANKKSIIEKELKRKFSSRIY